MRKLQEQSQKMKSSAHRSLSLVVFGIPAQVPEYGRENEQGKGAQERNLQLSSNLNSGVMR
jgi:hypothetical protein